jgi:hypothetical protein
MEAAMFILADQNKSNRFSPLHTSRLARELDWCTWLQLTGLKTSWWLLNIPLIL